MDDELLKWRDVWDKAQDKVQAYKKQKDAVEVASKQAHDATMPVEDSPTPPKAATESSPPPASKPAATNKVINE